MPRRALVRIAPLLLMGFAAVGCGGKEECSAGTFDDDGNPETACVSCTQCGDSEFVSGACAATQDTQCTPCSQPAAGQYAVQSCVAGSPTSAGADTTIQNCSDPAAGEHVSAVCVAGDASSPGSNTTIVACTTPAAGEYVTAACVAGDSATTGTNTVITTCTAAPATGSYVTTACVSGTYNTTGTDTATQTCNAPAVGSYVAVACVPGSHDTPGANTTTQPCDDPAAGDFVTATCVPGSYDTTGTNTATQTCTAPVAGDYVTAACVPGTYNATGTNTVTATCTAAPATGSYVTTACVPGAYNATGSDIATQTCSAPAAGDYVTAACIPGSYATTGTNTVTQTCTAPAAGSYVTLACDPGTYNVAGTDSATATCAEPSADSYTTDVCVQGDVNTVGTNTVIAGCAAPTATTYIDATCTSGSSAALGTNSSTAPCTTPLVGEYVSATCVGGSPSTLGSDTVTSACTTSISTGKFVAALCDPGEAAVLGSDLLQWFCSEPLAGEYVTATCQSGTLSLVGSDTVIAACSTPGIGEYVAAACVPGSSTATGSDSTLDTCTTATDNGCACDDGDPCSDNDLYTDGICEGTVNDIDGDGLADSCDNCGAGRIGASDPAVWYPLEETATPGQAPEIAGGQDGTYGSNVSFEIPSYITEMNDALVLPGTTVDSNMIAGNLTGMPKDQLSATLWVRLDDAGNHTLVSYASLGSVGDFGIFHRAGVLEFSVSGRLLTSGVSLTVGDWRHIGFTWDSATGAYEILLEGQSVETGIHAIGRRISDGGTLVLGQSQSSIGGGFDLTEALTGALDEVALYRHVLTHEEIQMQAGAMVCAVSCGDYAAISTSMVDGTYLIDPDAEVGTSYDAFLTACDMNQTLSPWTRVQFEDFESGTTSGWTNNSIGTCSTYGNVLGLFGYTNRDSYKTYDLLGMTHTETRMTADFLLIDSWDGEVYLAELDGTTLLSGTHRGQDSGAPLCGTSGSALWWNDTVLPVDGSVSHTLNTIEVHFRGNVNQPASDESYAIDNIGIWVR